MSTLTVLGRPLPPKESAVAVIGARAASAYGLHVAGEVATALADAGLAVVSGMAFGIDAAAHRACLAAQGHTVAVLACGIDVVYPRAHDRLVGQVRERGTLVSAYPAGSAPTRERFLERNAVIIELSAAVVVVEASLRSGSLSTARRALRAGVPVYAVPGPVTSVTSAGCHALIDEGAHLLAQPSALPELLR